MLADLGTTPKVIYSQDNLGVTLRSIHEQIIRGSRNRHLIDRAYSLFDLYPIPDISPSVVEYDQNWRILDAAYSLVMDEYGYVSDPATDEKVADIEAILRMQRGDCDEHVIYLGAMLAHFCIPFEVWLAGPVSAGIPTHVFIVAIPEPGHRVSADTTLKGAPLGTIPPGTHGLRPDPNWNYWLTDAGIIAWG